MGWPRWLLPFIPVAIVLDLVGAPATLIFATSALGTIPTAAAMSRATEELAARSGPGIGGLLNVSFGNAPELIIALFALHRGLDEVVKATLVGSILGNVLLVTGAAILIGGWGRERQTFNRAAASSQSLLLLIGIAALAMPAVFALSGGAGLPMPGDEAVEFTGGVERLSLAAAVVLILVYGAALFFSLGTHRDLYDAPAAHAQDEPAEPWSVRRSVSVLAGAGIAVAVMSEILVGSIAHTARAAGLSEFFIGAIVVAIVGNVAEHWVAVVVARKDHLDLSLGISIGSSVQIAMFVAPVLILASLVVGRHPMAFVLNGLELAALGISALVANQVTQDGESRWITGLGLLGLYFVFAFAFAFA
jgi:Ca2+:H+ antiporter